MTNIFHRMPTGNADFSEINVIIERKVRKATIVMLITESEKKTFFNFSILREENRN